MVSSLFMFMKISMTMMMFFALFVQNFPSFYRVFSALVVRVLAFALTSRVSLRIGTFLCR
tara:strand:- start:1943 stop:2122 length:180 start_codon:yes stop_codon:yes gene_type:complete